MAACAVQEYWSTKVASSAGEQPHRSAFAEPEAERRLVQDEVAAGGDRGAGGDRVEGVGVVAVLELQPAHVDRVRADVRQLGPVADRVAVGLDLVELIAWMPTGGQSLAAPLVEAVWPKAPVPSGQRP